MENNVILNEQNTNSVEELKQEVEKEETKDSFKFFGCCSKSLKRFSVIIFILNIFLSVGILGAVMVKIIVELGTAILPLLAVPIFTLFVILIILARFVSALIYGFAEIVEKNEK